MRRLLRDIAEGKALGDTTTLAGSGGGRAAEGRVRREGRIGCHSRHVRRHEASSSDRTTACSSADGSESHRLSPPRRTMPAALARDRRRAGRAAPSGAAPTRLEPGARCPGRAARRGVGRRGRSLRSSPRDSTSALSSPAQALARVVRPRSVDAATGNGGCCALVEHHGGRRSRSCQGPKSCTRALSNGRWARRSRRPRSELLDRYLLVSQIAPQLEHVIGLVRPVHGVTVTSVVACGNLPTFDRSRCCSSRRWTSRSRRWTRRPARSVDGVRRDARRKRSRRSNWRPRCIAGRDRRPAPVEPCSPVLHPSRRSAPRRRPRLDRAARFSLTAVAALVFGAVVVRSAGVWHVAGVPCRFRKWRRSRRASGVDTPVRSRLRSCRRKPRRARAEALPERQSQAPLPRSSFGIHASAAAASRIRVDRLQSVDGILIAGGPAAGNRWRRGGGCRRHGRSVRAVPVSNGTAWSSEGALWPRDLRGGQAAKVPLPRFWGAKQARRTPGARHRWDTPRRSAPRAGRQPGGRILSP